jgi:glycosyltransferase involved in cell wall biosynthesis
MPRRILYVITKANWGGAQRYVYDLATSAKEAGNEVLVVSGTEGVLTRNLREAGIEVKSVASMKRDVSVLAEIRALYDITRIVRDYTPEVIHGNSSKGGAFAGVAGRLCGVPHIIFTAHGWAFNEHRPWWQKKLIAFFHWLTVLLSHTTVCVSNAIARDIAGLPFVKTKLKVIHNGVDAAPLLARSDARTRLAPHLTAPFWIGTIAELHPTKQLPILIKAFARIAQTHKDIALVLIGEGEERKRLEAIAHAENFVSRIHFCGHVQDASSYLSAFDIFTLPSRSEAFSYVLLEAGHASLPVVASNVGGIPEVITNETTGLLVPSRDVDALANALERLLSDETLRGKLAQALHTRVIKEFSKEKMVRETLALY